jgi:hypothetical protein
VLKLCYSGVTVVLQWCYNDMGKSQGTCMYCGYTAGGVVWCYSNITVMIQWCGVSVVLQWCYSDVEVALKWWHSGVTVV